MLNQLREQFHQQQAEAVDLYHMLNGFRDWVNKSLVNYEVYLEDNWFEERTTIEYILRCLDTFNFLVLAEDEYKNFRKDGTWHLGEYVRTYWMQETPWQAIEAFIGENSIPREKV